MKNLSLGVLLFATCLLSLPAQTSAPSSRAEFTRRLVAAAVDRSRIHVRYTDAYVAIPYPGGDVPADTGACVDEIIRIYRQVGTDLQKEILEDEVRDFTEYGKLPHQARRPDRNIDHRRVANLQVFLRRHGEKLSTANNPADFLPGDIVIWQLPNGRGHVGMVVNQKPVWFDRYMVLHNIGDGPKIEDVVFDWKITGHFRYWGPKL